MFLWCLDVGAWRFHLCLSVFICVYLCPSVVELLKPLQIQGFLHAWTATVSDSVSMAADANTIRHDSPEFAETRPLLFHGSRRFCCMIQPMHMKTKYTLFRRNGIYY